MKQAKNAIPEKPIPTAKAALRPCIYATRTPGSWVDVNTFRSSVARVAITRAGSTLGAVTAEMSSAPTLVSAHPVRPKLQNEAARCRY